MWEKTHIVGKCYHSDWKIIRTTSVEDCGKHVSSLFNIC